MTCPLGLANFHLVDFSYLLPPKGIHNLLQTYGIFLYAQKVLEQIESATVCYTNITLYHVIYSVRYYPRFHVTAVGLGTYYPRIRGSPPVRGNFKVPCFILGSKRMCRKLLTVSSETTVVSSTMQIVRHIESCELIPSWVACWRYRPDTRKVKVKFTLEQAMKAQRVSRGIALIFL